MRKIAVITGTRAEYGIFKPVLNAIQNSDQLQLSLIVTGMHLLEEFGCTVKEIENDGFTIDATIPGLYSKDSTLDMAQSVGNAIVDISAVLDSICPDVLLILGDRGEMLAGAVAATYLAVVVAHIHGGEISGSVDGVVRHAITKLAHIHFPATEKSASRIVKMGEDSQNVFVVGAPGLDTIMQEKLVPPETLAQKYSIDITAPVILVVQHPVVYEDHAETQMKELMEAVSAFGIQTVVIYPNADAGGRKMIQVINQYESRPYIKLFKSMSHKDFITLMAHAQVMVGNSSSGIIEAPAFGLPVVNIGTRQKERERAENVIDVGHDREDIKKALTQALYNEEFRKKASSCQNPYGDGRASERIAAILSEIPLDNLMPKRLVYEI